MSNSWNQEFIRVLKEQLDQARQRNGRYSMRAFAKHTGISIAGLSRTLRGDLTISPERAAQMLERLDLDEDERSRLLTLMGRPPRRVRRTFSENMYEILTNWQMSAVWMAFEMEPEFRTPESLGARFGIPTETVQKYIDRLIEIGLLTQTPQGVEKENLAWQAGDNPPADILRACQHENMALAARSVEEIPPAERDVISLTVPGNPQQMEQVRAEIRHCIDRVSHILSSGRPRSELYRMQVALFPIRFAKSETKPN